MKKWQAFKKLKTTEKEELKKDRPIQGSFLWKEVKPLVPKAILHYIRKYCSLYSTNIP